MSDEMKGRRVTVEVVLTEEQHGHLAGVMEAYGHAGDEAALQALVQGAAMIGLSTMMTSSIVNASIGLLPKPGEQAH